MHAFGINALLIHTMSEEIFQEKILEDFILSHELEWVSKPKASHCQEE